MKAFTRRAGGLTLTSGGTQFGNVRSNNSIIPNAIPTPNMTRAIFLGTDTRLPLMLCCFFIVWPANEEGSPLPFPEVLGRGFRQSACVLRRSGAYPSRQ